MAGEKFSFGQVLRNVYDHAQKAIRVVITGVIEGTFTPSGARTVLKTAEVEVNDSTWTEIVLEKAQRNGLNLQNRSSANPTGVTNVYVNGENTDATAPPIGMRITPNSERQYAISEVALYVKTETGTTKITVEALG